MNLEKLEIERKHFGEHKGKYIAHVRIGEGRDSISLELSPRVSAIVLHACVDELSQATEEAANAFRDKLRAAVAGVPKLPPPLPEEP